VTVIDTQTDSVIATSDAAKKPWDVEVSDDGLYIYVASAGTGEIKVFSPEQLAGSSGG
jgi:DNA-binding beta-propeller fold protein YncE